MARPTPGPMRVLPHVGLPPLESPHCGTIMFETSRTLTLQISTPSAGPPSRKSAVGNVRRELRFDTPRPLREDDDSVSQIVSFLSRFHQATLEGEASKDALAAMQGS